MRNKTTRSPSPHPRDANFIRVRSLTLVSRYDYALALTNHELEETHQRWYGFRGPYWRALTHRDVSGIDSDIMTQCRELFVEYYREAKERIRTGGKSSLPMAEEEKAAPSVRKAEITDSVTVTKRPRGRPPGAKNKQSPVETDKVKAVNIGLRNFVESSGDTEVLGS